MFEEKPGTHLSFEKIIKKLNQNSVMEITSVDFSLIFIVN